jgi:hypothetical protein
LISSSKLLYAQDSLPDFIVLEGQVLSGDSLLPIKNTHIISKNNHWGSISNDNGKFKMYVNPYDSVLFTSIGFGSRVLYIDDSVMSQINEDFPILMEKDTIMINEILIRAFYDYETFKQIVVGMEPLNLDQFYPDWEGTELLYRPAVPTGFKGPTQMLYDLLNRDARLQRQLIKNRKDYNVLMRKLNRHMDTIPPKPEHMQE